MNVKLPKESLIKIITTYLDREVEPDYSWGPELYDFHREDVRRYGSFDFQINDKVSYSYGGENRFECQYCLYIEDHLSDQLTNLFGNLWIPIFKEWFEMGSGLEVTEMSVFNKLIEF
jgi:hypothetical protein